MTGASGCPERDVLQAFLLGQLPHAEAGPLAEHVERCTPCLTAMQSFHDSDAMLQAMQMPIPDSGSAHRNQLDELMTRLCALHAGAFVDSKAAGGLLARLAASTAEATQELYAFLAPAQKPDEIGRLGPYRVLRMLGSGGMGVVFEVEDTELRRRVALKVLRPRLLDDPAARQRFLREARAAAGLAHDLIMPILHIGEERGVPYLVMPLLEGETLEARLKREPCLPLADLLRLGIEIAAGLAAAHEHGLIHRDIKPSNIWLETVPGEPSSIRRKIEQTTDASTLPSERVKLLDFGLVRAVSGEATLTYSGAIVGTPAYMAPEQAREEALDVRCDLFSLGCVLYRMATGEVPFKGATIMATLRALELVTPQPPRLLNPAVPRALSNLILQLLAKRPADRPASARAVGDALQAIQASPADTGSRRRRPWVWTGTFIVLGILGLLTYLLYQPDPSDPPEPPAPPARDISASAAAWPGFEPVVFYKPGAGPVTVRAHDLNGDGRLDLVVTNSPGNSVSVFFGKGDGTFQEPVHFDAGQSPEAVEVADVNSDGKPDLVVVNLGKPDLGQRGAVSILLGDGAGSFAKPVPHPVGFSPHGVALGDFKGDGKLDLVVAHAGIVSRGKKGELTLLLGNGDGTFRPAVTLEAEGFPTFVVAQDFNGDGKLDLAVTDQINNCVRVLLGNGNGTFQPAVSYPTGEFPLRLAVGDLNADGKPDLVLCAHRGGAVSVLLGNGDGTFQKAVSYEAGKAPVAVALADVNGDGKLDVAVADSANASLIVLLGNGDGTFQAPRSFLSGQVPNGLTVGDFNRDGAPDIAVVNQSHVGVLLQRAAPPRETDFGPPRLIETGLHPRGVAVADLNGDGKLDLAVANYRSDSVSILLGQGDGAFQAAIHFPTGVGPLHLGVGDFNGDGKLDLATANGSVTDDGARGGVSILLGKGDGTFQKPMNYRAGPHPQMLAVGDFNGDGKLDLAVADNFHNGGVSVLLGKGDGTFHPAVFFPTGKHCGSLAVADLNGDGKLDLAVTNETDAKLSVLLGKGDGTFLPAVPYPVGSGPTSVAVGDFNGDGKLDLAVGNFHGVTISVLLGRGDGAFHAARAFTVGARPSGVAVGDFNGDGKLDLAAANYDSNSLSFLFGHGDGSFQAALDVKVGSGPQIVAVGDFNRDGRLDVVANNRFANSIAVLLNRPPLKLAHR